MRRAGTAIYSVMVLALGATPLQSLAQPMEDRPLLKRLAAAALWTGTRNRDFYCDAGRHRKRDRNSDGRRRRRFLELRWCKRQLIRYDDQWQCGPGEVHCHWLSGGGQAQATAQTNFGNFTSVQTTSTSPVSSYGTGVQSHRPVVSFLLPTRSLQARVFPSLADRALVL